MSDTTKQPLTEGQKEILELIPTLRELDAKLEHQEDRVSELAAELDECREKNLWCVNENLRLQKQVKQLREALESILRDPDSMVVRKKANGVLDATKP